MNESNQLLNGYHLKIVRLNTAVLGSGAAGFNAADRLWQYGQRDIALVTEGLNTGTSRNTGSDKQTYYKLSLAGDEPDSVVSLAEVLFSGECVDGDHALCEAALSPQCFLRLAELGVPFPQNRYGEYVGYKTDHDPGCRATSVGPYTSRVMTECLERSVREKGIPIYDGLQAVRIFTEGGRLLGFLCIDKKAENTKNCLVLFQCQNLILATGGPAGMYADSAFPLGHYGANGLAFEAGAKGKNLTEWQFGLASVKPRWNVSGTYMQVLPKFVSTDRDGGDPREFLSDFFAYSGKMLSLIFLKGYQWPFDVRKLHGGSSIIDLLVYIETGLKGRRVFLDFRENPGGGALDFSCLSREALDYLQKADACFGTPIERLSHMNAPAVHFFMERGVNLETQPLEIRLCAQHNNGGLDIDCWWQTNISGLFAAGEAAASHGVYRPGGSALNAGQVGSARAARYIAERRTGDPESTASFLAAIESQLLTVLDIAEASKAPPGEQPRALWQKMAEKMGRTGGAVRNADEIRQLCQALQKELLLFPKAVHSPDTPIELAWVFRLRETLICQYVYLGAMLDYIEQGGKSRGSALYTDGSGQLPCETLPEIFRFTLDNGSRANLVQIIEYAGAQCRAEWREVRSLPLENRFFENVWRSYRENKNVF